MNGAALVSADCSRSELVVLVIDVLVAIAKVLIPRVVSAVLGFVVLSTSRCRFLGTETARGLLLCSGSPCALGGGRFSLASGTTRY